MMWLPFNLPPGAEWQDSLDAIDPRPPRFERHMEAIRYALKRDPVGWTEGYLVDRDDLRVFRTQDFANGYELIVFVRVDQGTHTCELKWIEMRDLAPDEPPDEGPQGLP